MAHLMVIGVYGAIGAGAAAFAARLGHDAKTCLAMVALWPFLLPTLQGESRPADPAPDPKRDGRLDQVARALDEAWAAVAALGAERREERARLDRFVAQLRAQAVRIAEMDLTLAGAPDRLRGPLQQLRARTAAELAGGLELLEELVAQLTLLRFTGGPDGLAARAERDHVEALLARVGALAEVTGTAAA